MRAADNRAQGKQAQTGDFRKSFSWHATPGRWEGLAAKEGDVDTSIAAGTITDQVVTPPRRHLPFHRDRRHRKTDLGGQIGAIPDRSGSEGAESRNRENTRENAVFPANSQERVTGFEPATISLGS